MNPDEAQPAVLYQAALLIRAGSLTRIQETLEAAGAVIEEIPRASGRARHYDVSMPEPAERGTFLKLRERQVLERLAQGMSSRDIAADLFLSYDTVKTHTKALYRQLKVGSRAHAVAVGYQRGLLGGE